MLGSLILGNFFGSNLYSLLTISQYEGGITTIKELLTAARTDTHRILMRRTSAYFSRFVYATAENPTFYPIGLHINRTSGVGGMFADNRLMIATVAEDSTKVIVSPRPFLAYNRKFSPKRHILSIGREDLLPDTLGLVFQKRSPLVLAFNTM